MSGRSTPSTSTTPASWSPGTARHRSPSPTATTSAPSLDRNGLRPSRYYVTDDDLVIMASEVGVLRVPPERVIANGRLRPGRMFLVDFEEGRIIDDEEIKERMADA